MFKKGIARRWLFNSLGVMILLFTACIAALSFVVQSYAYNGIQMTLIGRSDELPTVLSGSMKTVCEFNDAAVGDTAHLAHGGHGGLAFGQHFVYILRLCAGPKPEQARF